MQNIDYMQVVPMVRDNADFDQAARDAGWEGAADLLDTEFNLDEHDFLESAFFMLDCYYPVGDALRIGDITVMNTMGSENERNRWYPCDYVVYTDNTGALFIESDGSF
jgi:hypothetical protein